MVLVYASQARPLFGPPVSVSPSYPLLPLYRIQSWLVRTACSDYEVETWDLEDLPGDAPGKAATLPDPPASTSQGYGVYGIISATLHISFQVFLCVKQI